MGKLKLVIETDRVSIYSLKKDGETMTEFEKFLSSNMSHSHPQLQRFFDAVISIIEKIGECGARENLFRPEGGRVKAVPLLVSISRIDRSVGKMRLYCLRYSDKILIIGNGGVSIERRYEDDPVLLSYVDDLRKVDRLIKQRAKQQGADFSDYVALSGILKSITL